MGSPPDISPEGMSILAAPVRRLDVNGLRGQHSVQQAGETGLEVAPTELGELRRPLALLTDHAGLPEDPGVVGHRRLGDTQLDRSTRTRRSAVGERPNDLEPLRVAERMQHGRQLDLAPIGVMQFHLARIRLYDRYRTIWYDAHRTIEPA